MIAISFPLTADANPHIQIVTAGPDMALSAAAAAADTATGGQVMRALATARFDGEAGSIVEIMAPANLAATRLLVIGTGAADKATAAVFEKLGGAIAARCQASGEARASIDLSGVTAALPLEAAAAQYRA